jgi:hypothetical protein
MASILFNYLLVTASGFSNVEAKLKASDKSFLSAENSLRQHSFANNKLSPANAEDDLYSSESPNITRALLGLNEGDSDEVGEAILRPGMKF